eukprot:NODE_1471_length_895_cov_205.872340_g1139_i0.p1 GENE.NODE_1471_length_895_cov_205.872340_g1139_i0~~NODE_1471_length_895_cov_205.872340_g1139_i0.p1  ORF type:complete len:241 (-),score=40.33 NODE_1471_length_895_cov_205.872340_g1139_i0:172-816(-)
MTCLREAKCVLRRQIRDVLRHTSAAAIAQQSAAVFSQLRTCEWLRTAQTFGVFLSMHDEVDTTSIIDELLTRRHTDANIRVFVPFMDDPANSHMQFLEIDSLEDLRQNFALNKWNILEPTPSTLASRCDLLRSGVHLDVMLIPGLAFSRSCQRLGRGKGFYDRFLTNLTAQQTTPLLVGLSLSCQLVDWVPTDEQDFPLHHIVHPDGVLSSLSS